MTVPSTETTLPNRKRKSAAWPVYLAAGLLGIFALIFIVEFINLSRIPEREPVATTLTADTYMQTVNSLLENADASRAPELLEKYACYGCHLYGVLARLGPSFEGVAERAAVRNPPLTAAAYLYEAIVYPEAFAIEGFSSEMPVRFGELPDDELGAIIAYLLQQ